MAKTKKFKEEVTAEVNGEIYTGYRIIKGSRVMYQTIWYKDESETDGMKYPPERQKLMLGEARYFLRKLVKKYHKL